MDQSDLRLEQNLGHILPPSWREEVPRWFAEDTPSYDWAGFVVGEEEQEAWLLGKSAVRLRCSRFKRAELDRVYLLVFRSSKRSSAMLGAGQSEPPLPR